MNLSDAVLKARPAYASEQEWALRLELAACYRLFAFLGWTELIFNHITTRVPGPEKHYLINPFGLHYSEVTAANLIRVNLAGEAQHETPWSVNRAGFVIHSAIHAVREDAHCIMHVHTTAGMAVACKEAGLGNDNFYSAQLQDDVAYHDYEGVTTRLDEGTRLVASLGARNCMILRNHGLLACDHDVPAAFFRLWTLNRACEIQMAAAAIPGANRALSAEAIAASNHDVHRTVDPQGHVRRKIFDAMVRRAGVTRFEDLL
jgi:ribulose-5-phosphate 4-epimerase/fuculose-1-phosphate aldolase